MRLFTPPGGVPRMVRAQEGYWRLEEPAVGEVDDRWVVPGEAFDGLEPRKNAVKQASIVEALRAGDEAGAERQLRAQREFLSDHLLNWIDRFTADVRKAAEDGFYFDLATFTEGFLTADAAELAEVLG